MAIFQVYRSQIRRLSFSRTVSFLVLSAFLNRFRGFRQSCFLWQAPFSVVVELVETQSQVSEIGFKVFSQGFGKFGSFCWQSLWFAKSFFQQVFWLGMLWRFQFPQF